MGIIYHFNSEVAIATGHVEDAIVLENIRFWMIKNRANNKNYHDGKYWTYNTMQAWSELYKFWSARQIRTILNRLETNGFIITGCYNKLSFDRTKWYSLTEKALELFGEIEIQEPKEQKCNNAFDTSVTSELTDTSNENRQKCKNNTIYNTDEKTDNINISSDKSVNNDKNDGIEELINTSFENKEVKALMKEWIADRKSRKILTTKRAVSISINKLNKYNDKTKIAALKTAIERGYRGVFPESIRGVDDGELQQRNRNVLQTERDESPGSYDYSFSRKTEEFIRNNPELLR